MRNEDMRMYSTHATADYDALLNEVQAADFLRLSIRTLQAWRGNGKGPSFVRAGRAVRYRRRDLCNWADANTVTVPAGVFIGRVSRQS
jgi:hypothetical protein